MKRTVHSMLWLLMMAMPSALLAVQCPTTLTQAQPPSRGSEQNKTGVTVRAEQLVSKAQQTEARGNVEVRLPDSQFFADQATIDAASGAVRASGHLRFESDSVQMHAEQLTADSRQQKVTLGGAQYQLRGSAGRGKAGHAEIDVRSGLLLRDAAYTTCPEGDESWQIRAAEIGIDARTGYGHAKHMLLYIGDVPVLYLPYLLFPAKNERTSGLLAPVFENSDINGQELALPIYLNLAPNYDMTLTPRWMSERGTLWESEFRYLSEHSQGQVDVGYLGDDKLAEAPTPSRRYQFRWRQDSRWGPHWKMALEYHRVSDDSYFFDMGRDLYSSSIVQLRRDWRLDYADDEWQFLARVSADDALNAQTDPYRRYPQLAFQYQPVKDHWMISGEAVRFERDAATSADRIHLRTGYQLSKEGLSGFFRFNGMLDWRYYEQRQPSGQQDQLTITTPLVSLDAGVYLERRISLFSHKWLQTLEPRLFYLYVPYRDQRDIGLYDTGVPIRNYQWLFRTNRYTGIDRLGDADRLSVGMSSRLYSASDGREVFRWGIGQAVNFRSPRVDLASSVPDAASVVNQTDAKETPIFLDAQLSPYEHWQASSAIEWRPDTGRTEAASFRLQYRRDDKHLLNVAHRTRRLVDGGSVEQIDLSGVWQVAPQWHMLGRYYRDLAHDQAIEWVAGVAYEDCCWAVRLVKRRYLSVALDAFGQPLANTIGRYNTGLYLEFVFKGLSSLGNTGFLQKSISGYQDPFFSN